MILFFYQFIVGVQSIPDAITDLRIHLFHLLVKASDIRPVRLTLVGTELLLLLIALHFSIGLDVLFLYHTQRTDDCQRHPPHFQACWHRAESALEGEVHQCRMQHVVLMVTKGDFVAAKFLSEIEELFAAVP